MRSLSWGSRAGSTPTARHGVPGSAPGWSYFPARVWGDLGALVELGFESGFNANGTARAPWIGSGIVICPGAIVERSALSHECSFVNVGGDWVWESEELLLDEVRRVPGGPRTHQRSVSLLDAREGLELDVLASKKRQGVHQLQSKTSYEISDGVLRVVATRA